MPTFRLVLQSGSGMGTEYPLEKNEMFLGRDLSNDIVINDPEVSRRHARLLLSGNTFILEDLGSTNGTFIHGQRLGAPVVLRPGDMITIGEKVLLKFEIPAVDPNATVAAFRGASQQTQQPFTPVTPRVPPAAPVTPAFIPSQPPVSPTSQPEKAYQAPQPVVPSYTPSQPSAQVTPPVHPVAPVVTPPQAVSPAYSQLPVTPAYRPVTPPMSAAAQPTPVKKKSGWLIALLIVIGILVVFCLIPWIIIEVTNSYCALFPGIFNSIQPGACP